jgi:hypothetical protein
MFDGPTINVMVSANIATVEIHLTVWVIVVPSDSASIEPRFCGPRSPASLCRLLPDHPLAAV